LFMINNFKLITADRQNYANSIEKLFRKLR
jgi:hypothetical protein